MREEERIDASLTAGGNETAGPVDRWTIAAILLVLITYSPVVFFEYGFSEDYRLLAANIRGAGLSPLMLAEGRPLFAVWAKLVFGAAGGIGTLVLVRAMNVVFLAAIAALAVTLWRKAGLPSAEAAAAGAMIVTLPAFQLFAGTAAMGAVLPAIVLALAAALLTDGEGLRRAGPRRSRLVAASLLAFAALVTYQPSGLFYWVAMAILLVGPARPVALRRRLAWFAVVAAPAMVAAFVVFLLGRSAFPGELIEIGAPRGTLAFDPGAKALWFLTLPLPHALNLWKLWPNIALALVMMVVLAAGLLLHVRGRDAVLRATIAFGLVPLCYLPNLVVAEDRSSFRSQPALAAIVLAYYVIVLRSQFAGSRQWVARALLAAGVAVGALSAGRNVVALIAAPQARELALVRQTVAGIDPSVRLVGVVPSDYRDSSAPVVLYDEFGYPSTALPWSVYTMTWLALRERIPGDTAAVHVTDARDAAVVPDTVIDWGEILRAAR